MMTRAFVLIGLVLSAYVIDWKRLVDAGSLMQWIVYCTLLCIGIAWLAINFFEIPIPGIPVGIP